MRGKVKALYVRQYLNRITPAYAGKSCRRRMRPAGNKDHPRICGEKWPLVNRQVAQRGSPPHMRGKALPPTVISGSPRITPAYAGKSPRHSRCSAQAEDHPRICGEKRSLCSIQQIHEGSPPHMRGKALSSMIHAIWSRITPAYAGKRRGTLKRLAYGQDHPRICGEKSLPLMSRQCLPGSPPHMRGKDKMPADERGEARITPAYAGKSVIPSP